MAAARASNLLVKSDCIEKGDLWQPLSNNMSGQERIEELREEENMKLEIFMKTAGII